MRARAKMLPKVLALVAAACAAIGDAKAGASDLYTTTTVTSGTAPERRAIGFIKCFRDVLVKLSGDPKVLAEPSVQQEAGRAGQLIANFTFRDRLSGVPMHDEQGSYDRPHDLTCVFDQAKLDAFLATLGRKPWLERPRLVAVIGVRDMKGRQGMLAADSDGPRDADMRSALAAAAERQGLDVALATQAALAAAHVDVSSLQPSAEAVALSTLGHSAGRDLALVGTLVWSEKSPAGWIADWRILGGAQSAGWQVSGVGFDEAFRIGVGGVAQRLSENGSPR